MNIDHVHTLAATIKCAKSVQQIIMHFKNEKCWFTWDTEKSDFI